MEGRAEKRNRLRLQTNPRKGQILLMFFDWIRIFKTRMCMQIYGNQHFIESSHFLASVEPTLIEVGRLSLSDV